MKNGQTTVTSFSDMKAQVAPVIPIPGWDDTPVNVRLRKVSLMNLVSRGLLPNELLGIANKVAKGTGYNPVKDGDEDDFKNFTNLLNEIAKASLVEPTYDQIVEEVGDLTDNQLSAIYLYCTAGLKALEFFRKRLESPEEVGDSSEDVLLPAE